jgi:hypothetical protein
MPIPVLFDKSKTERFLDYLASGKPIGPPGGSGWTVHDVLALAGACRFVASTHEPSLYLSPAVQPALPEGHPEHAGPVEESFGADLDATIAWYSHASRMVHDGEYDRRFEPRHQALVSAPEVVKRRVQIVSGKKAP